MMIIMKKRLTAALLLAAAAVAATAGGSASGSRDLAGPSAPQQHTKTSSSAHTTSGSRHLLQAADADLIAAAPSPENGSSATTGRVSAQADGLGRVFSYAAVDGSGRVQTYASDVAWGQQYSGQLSSYGVNISRAVAWRGRFDSKNGLG